MAEEFGTKFNPEGSEAPVAEDTQVEEPKQETNEVQEEGLQEEGQQEEVKEEGFGQKYDPTNPPQEVEEGEPTPASPPKEGEQPEAQEQETKEFDISAFFKDKFETEIQGEDDIKEILNKASRIDDLVKELEEAKTSYDSISEKYEAYKKYEDGFDPLESFASAEDYKAQQYRKQNPDKDPSVIQEAFTSDLSKFGDLDLLAKYEKLNNPNIGDDATIKEELADRFGIDAENINDPSEWSNIQKVRVAKEANLARKEFNEMKESINVPEKVNIDEQLSKQKEEAQQKKEALKGEWEKVLGLQMQEFKDIPIYDNPDKDGNQEKLIDFSVTDDMRKELSDDMMSYLTENNLEVNEDNIKQAGEVATAKVILANLPQIMKSYQGAALAEQEESHNKEIHNPAKPKIQEKPGKQEEPRGFEDALTHGRSVRRRQL